MKTHKTVFLTTHYRLHTINIALSNLTCKLHSTTLSSVSIVISTTDKL